MDPLFSPRFLSAISRLTLAVNDAPRGHRTGHHLSAQAGNSLEFRDFQPYSPGDDLRRVDWNLYGRTRELVVRQFERPTAVPIHVFLDNSASMHAESPSRYVAAAHVAAAIASAAVSGGNPVHLLISSADGLVASRPVSDRRALAGTLHDLSRDHARANGLVQSVLASARAIAKTGAGVFFVLSDCFEPAGSQVLIDALRQIHHRLVVVQMMQPWDAEPKLAGNVRLRDSESNNQLDVRIDDNLRRRYRASYERYMTPFASGLAARDARRLEIDASADPLPQLERLFPAGVLSA